MPWDSASRRSVALDLLSVVRSKGSRHHNMKELRPPGTNIRILFAFDPRRTAILLLGGDKSDRWREWYKENIPVAERLYDTHLDELRKEGEFP